MVQVSVVAGYGYIINMYEVIFQGLMARAFIQGILALLRKAKSEFKDRQQK